MMNLLQKQIARLTAGVRGKVNSRSVIGTPSGSALSGGTLKAGRVVGISGDSDLYTVPDGKVAFVVAVLRVNPTGGAITNLTSIVTGADSMRMNFGSSSVNAGAVNNNAGTVSAPLMIAGDILRANDSGAGLIHLYSIIEAPASLNTHLKLARLFQLSTTAQKIYEAPAGIAAFAVSSSAFASSTVTFFNNSGTGAKTCSLYLVPPGQSVAAEYLIGSASVADNGVAGFINFVPAIPQGFSLWATSSNDDAGVKCRTIISEQSA